MADDVAATILKASAGLEYPSESDAAFDLIEWDPAKGEPTAASVAVLGATSGGSHKARPVQQVPVDEFFSALAETDNAAGFKALEQLLKKSLNDIKIFRLGGSPKVDIYLLGRTSTGNWLGLHTTSVET